MKILHTSDWHLGHVYCGRRRHEEFVALLDWMAETVQGNEADVLLICGDVFDHQAPSQRTQALYYRFLSRIAQTGCRHVVVTAGNHDSAALLEAPRQLLAYLNIYVVGRVTDDPSDEVLLLKDEKGQPELIVAAVPFLRERDLREGVYGESLEDKERKIRQGIIDHYNVVCEIAQKRRDSLAKPVPLVVMGHLFAAGAPDASETGAPETDVPASERGEAEAEERDLYVGTLGKVDISQFPEGIDYLALGHIHRPQILNGKPHYRYCGAPVTLSFSDVRRVKQVLLTELDGPGHPARISAVQAPVFRPMIQVAGDWDGIERGLTELAGSNAPVWAEVIYEGGDVAADLPERVRALTEGSAVDVLRIRNQNAAISGGADWAEPGEVLRELKPEEVFVHALREQDISEDQRERLRLTFLEALARLDEDEEG
jgi:exonuclease SbcD